MNRTLTRALVICSLLALLIAIAFAYRSSPAGSGNTPPPRGQAPPSLPSARHRHALAYVARQIILGEVPPRFASFPNELRHEDAVEVLVTVHDHTKPARVWRSSQASSLAAGVLRASTTVAARLRELGKDQEQYTENSEVTVSLVIPEGEVALAKLDDLNKLIKPNHGIGYRKRGDWRYVLPEHRRAPTPVGDLQTLLTDNGERPEAWSDPSVTLYRFTVLPLATSGPSDLGSDE